MLETLNIEGIIAAIGILGGVLSGIGNVIQGIKNRNTSQALSAAQETAKKAKEGIQKINQFFDPDDDNVIEAPAELAPVAYRMSEEVKNAITAGRTETEKAIINAAVQTNEAAGISNYLITLPSGEWYKIAYGQITASGKPEIKKMPADVRTFLLAGHTEAEKTILNNAVNQTEAAGISKYLILLPSGAWYTIKNGQINGSGSAGSPIPNMAE